MRKVALFFASSACRAGEPIDVKRLASEFEDSVDAVRVYEDFHDSSSLAEMTALVRERGISAVILAGRSPDHYEATLGGDHVAEELARAGVNPNLIIHANLAEHCSLPHAGAPAGVLFQKAKALTEVALLDARIRSAVEIVEVPPRRRALVIGSGAAAMVAAYRLVDLGIRVVVASASDGWRWSDAEKAHLAPSVSILEGHELCTLAFATQIRGVTGWAGDYETILAHEGATRRERFGGIIVAVGEDCESYMALWPLLQIDSTRDGRPYSRNAHTLSVRSTTSGVAIVPPPRAGEEALPRQTADATAAVLEITDLLNKPWLAHRVAVSKVDASHCGLCRTCIKVCAFNACSIDEHAGTSKVDERLCKACGNCVVACPAGARDLITGPTAQITGAIDLLAGVKLGDDPRVLAMLCAGCAYRAADTAAKEGHSYPASVLPLRVQCGGRVDMQHVLQAFEAGFDGVVIGTCREGKCHNIVGHLYLDRRVVLLRDLLRERGIDPERLQIMDISPHEGELCAKTLADFVGELSGAMSGAT
ncbi:MAG: hydrogenase iron-sulfur subunit [Planctomycetes bacterium]|nr:hydrogenase iron-sulfur subunit [Planctomycetota bacterium]